MFGLQATSFCNMPCGSISGLSRPIQRCLTLHSPNSAISYIQTWGILWIFPFSWAGACVYRHRHSGTCTWVTLLRVPCTHDRMHTRLGQSIYALTRYYHIEALLFDTFVMNIWEKMSGLNPHLKQKLDATDYKIR